MKRSPLFASLLFVSLLAHSTALADPAVSQPVSSAPAVAPASQPSAPPSEAAKLLVPTKVDLKDQALQFILTKAEKYSGKAEDAIGMGVDAAMREGPILLTEYLKWHAWRAALMFALPFVFLIASLTTLIKAWNRGPWETEGYRSKVTDAGIVGIIGIILSVFSLIPTLANIPQLFDLIEIIVAPRVYLIEAVSQLVKG